MTRDEYFSLVRTCDEILLAPDAPADVVAVPWLHVLREHPTFLDDYGAVFQPRRWFSDVLDGWRQRLRSEWYLRRSPHGRQAIGAAGRADVLFVSHLLNAGQLEASEDFYFAHLPAALADAGASTCVALIDHTRDGVTSASRRSPGRHVLAQRLAAADERTIGRRLAGVARYLRSAGRSEGDDMAARVRACAARFARGPGARTTMRIGMQVEALVRHVRPSLVVTTYEGHAWERVSFAAARRGNPAVKVAGYHMTALFPLQHALSRRLGRGMDPDVVLTAGLVTRDALRARSGLSGIPVHALGSNRRLDSEGFDRTQTRPGCVVLPEGILSECRILFRFAIECARRIANVRWFLRLHPLISFDQVRSDLDAGGVLPSNVVLSTRSLSEDFTDSSWALYRGSSASIQALAAGLRPIYLRGDEPFSIDPMSGLETWRLTVGSGTELQQVLAGDLSAPAASLAADRSRGIRYAADYFQPLDSGVLLRILAAGRPE